MDSEPNIPAVTKGEIRFSNDNRAVFVKAPMATPAIDLIAALEIKSPATVLLLIGGADDMDPRLHAKIEELLEFGLATAASDVEALIVDGGTKAGVMALIGSVIARGGHVTKLLGVAPAGKVSYPGGPQSVTGSEKVPLDPNHSHFLLVGGDQWSDGTRAMFAVLDQLAGAARIVGILVNGGDEAKEEVSRCAERGWPVVVIKGSGRLADEIAAHLKITSNTAVAVCDLDAPPLTFRHAIVRHAEGALFQAWRRFAEYDAKAASMQKTYKRFLIWTLALGVVGTLLALTQKRLAETLPVPYSRIMAVAILAAPVVVVGALMSFKRFRPRDILIKVLYGVWAVVAALVFLAILVEVGTDSFLRYISIALRFPIILVPITVSILLASSSRFKPGNKWILLRGAAETLKQEIYRYRARVGPYDEPVVKKPDLKSRDQLLAEKLATIGTRLMQTEVNTASLFEVTLLPPKFAVSAGDDGFSLLTSDEYMKVRVADQLDFYRRKTRQLERQLTQFQWLIYIVGGLGTFLAAVGAQIWIALTTAIVTALTAWIGHLQIEPTLVQYNQAANGLANVEAWWASLAPSDKNGAKTRAALVDKSEEILQGELSGWVQKMESAVSNLPAPADVSHKG